jgi:hypothetical protein
MFILFVTLMPGVRWIIVVFGQVLSLILNIIDGRNNRLEMALKALSKLNIDLAILTETKLGDIHTRQSSGYEVWCAPVINTHQGGVALVHKRSSRWHFEDIKTFGPNIIRGKLIGCDRPLFIIGGYIPPSETDGTTLAHLDRALHGLDTKQCIFLGDINVNLDCIKNARGEAIATSFSCYNLSDVRKNFRPKEKFSGRKGWTWSKRREGFLNTSICDVILAGDPNIFRSFSLRIPAFETDHRLLRGELSLGVKKVARKYCNYLKARSSLPVKVFDPNRENDCLLKNLKEKTTFEKTSPANKPSWISAKALPLPYGRVGFTGKSLPPRNSARRFVETKEPGRQGWQFLWSVVWRKEI